MSCNSCPTVNDEGVYTGHSDSYVLCGFIRKEGRVSVPLSHLLYFAVVVFLHSSSSFFLLQLLAACVTTFVYLLSPASSGRPSHRPPHFCPEALTCAFFVHQFRGTTLVLWFFGLVANVNKSQLLLDRLTGAACVAQGFIMKAAKRSAG
jgi:hypothetical protein